MLPIPSMESLLAQVEPLSHRRRCAALIDVGRRSVSAGEPERSTLQRIIADLGAPEQVHYRRLQAAFALRGAYDEAGSASLSLPVILATTARSLLKDPSFTISRLLMTSCIVTPLRTAVTAHDRDISEAAAVELLMEAGPREAEFLCKRISGEHLSKIAATLFGSRKISESPQLQTVLGYSSPEEFERWPEEVQLLLGGPSLRLLCQRHPEWIAGHLIRQVQDELHRTTVVGAALQLLVLKALEHLGCRGSFTHGVALFTATAHLMKFNHCDIKNLLQRYYLSNFPAEVGRYLLDGEGKAVVAALPRPLRCTLPHRAWKRLRCHTDLLLRLIERQILPSMPECLPRMSAEAREVCFQRYRAALQNNNDIISANVLASRPCAVDRATEARACYNHPQIQDSPVMRIAFLRYVAFPEAIQLGTPFVSSNDASVRCEVVWSCIASLKYYPQHLPTALGFCLQRLQEQDPWRVQMFRAWADLPLPFWRKTSAYMADADLLAQLSQLFHSAYNAKDLSNATLEGMADLIWRLIGPHTAFAVGHLLTLFQKRKTFTAGRGVSKMLQHLHQLHPEALPLILQLLLPQFSSPLRRDEVWLYDGVLDSILKSKPLVTAFLREGKGEGSDLPSHETVLLRVLELGLLSSDCGTARKALQLYQRYLRLQLLAQLPALVEQNRDWLRQPDVQRLVCDIVQGPLLDALVEIIWELPPGHLHHENGVGCPVLCELPTRYAHRWTAKQQTRYAQSILQMLYRPGTSDVFTYRGLVGSLAALPSVRSTTSWTTSEGKEVSLITLATEEHPEHGSYFKGFALHALGKLKGDSEATAALQRSLEDPELRMEALRALSGVLRRAPGSEAVRVLEPLLMGKSITAQKEALHLLGSRRDAAAFARLVAFASERHLPMPAAPGDVDAPAHLHAALSTSDNGDAAKMAMHRDVRAALVTALFNYIHKPQVWAYYVAIGYHDCVTPTPSSCAAAHATGNTVDEEGNSREALHAPETTASTPSAAACEAMTTLSWTDLRASWQVNEYQKLLRMLLSHPVRAVHVAALHRLESIPPYCDMGLCRAVAFYLSNFTDARLVRYAMKCMLACRAPEATAFVVSCIIAVAPDSSLETVTQVFSNVVQLANVREQPRLHSIVRSVVQQLTASRRQPQLIISLLYLLDMAEWTPQLTALQAAELMHPGAAAFSISAMDSYATVSKNFDIAEALEATTLRTHSSALMRRMGLEIILLARARHGWNEERRHALNFYTEDPDLWVSSDARLVRKG